MSDPVQTAEARPALAAPVLKPVLQVRPAPQGHWVGDGFPVRTMFAYDDPAVSPFLLLDYAGPYQFAPAAKRRGVGEHPHRGFETVTLVYSGEVEHRDSGGGGGTIGPGDVQWMTAGSGVVHEEMHSQAFTETGGPFEAVQLWVNLPTAKKMTAPHYQTILNADIPVVALEGDAGFVRVIAGTFDGAAGPARTHTPMALLDMRLAKGRGAEMPVPAGHAALILVMRGAVRADGARVGTAELAVLGRDGDTLRLDAEEDAAFLVLTGAPIDEPVVGYGPFVMNTEQEIRQAIADYQAGRMGHLV